MDTHERSQVRLILEHLTSETLRKTEGAQKAMQAEHSAKGLLQSGNTVRRAVDIIEDHASKLVEQAVDQVSAVAQDIDAFNVIVASLTAMFKGFDPHLQEGVRLATIRDGKRSQSVMIVGNKLFSEMRSRIFSQLELHRFSFARPTRGDLAAQRERIVGILEPTDRKRSRNNRGGKPLAAHWDAMWADIAIRLWDGSLIPKKQSDIKAAMFEWLNTQEIDASDTAVTERARVLWRRWQKEL